MSSLCSRNVRPRKALVGRAQGRTLWAISGVAYTSKLGRLIIARACDLAERLFERLQENVFAANLHVSGQDNACSPSHQIPSTHCLSAR